MKHPVVNLGKPFLMDFFLFFQSFARGAGIPPTQAALHLNIWGIKVPSKRIMVSIFTLD